MKLNLFNVELSISRKNSHVTSDLSKKDIDELNAEHIQNILMNGKDYYIDKSQDISLPTADDKNKISDAVQRLSNDGIFITPSFVEASHIEELCQLIESYSNDFLLKLKKEKYYEDELALIQTKQCKIKGYASLAAYPKATLDIRSGSDEGMIDIFNVDKLLKGTKGEKIIDQIVNNHFLNNLLNSLPTPLVIRNLNSYVNSGITSTRGFHVDTYQEQIKIFIYLTDVLELDNGPYTYVKGSHKDSHYHRINQYLSKNQKAKTETPVVPFDQVYPILAPKGSLVISDQSGSHRGFPQSKTGKRRVLTINCAPK
ncbi:phytanoyl-CoA dioxygenase family protein [Psychrobacter sp. UBA5136]|uniref:phytanoyl-CoA dioxygenase family protein n=1 Tax=Psychrobacter sp. UBA5136 TaxID=1947356 RepID=UPI0025E3552B|nr:phytanoyl-CoA dioxygenase family protein [Psychrobacter sp. UBA5136]